MKGGYKMTELANWLDSEIDSLTNQLTAKQDFPESLKLPENKVTEIEIDFKVKFEKRPNKMNPQTIQALIPCTFAGVKKTFWLNVANPLYAQICKAGKTGKTKFKIMRIGKQKDTRYTLVED